MRITLKKIVDHLWMRAGSRIQKFVLRRSGVKFGKELVLYGAPIVSRAPESFIEFGDRVVLCSSSRYTALGVSHPVVLRTLEPGAKIVLGDDVGISGGTICSASIVRIGARTMLGADVVVTDTDFHKLDPQNRRYSGRDGAKTAGVTIGENVFVGTGAIILKGVTVGNNSVIGAKSVVTSDIPVDVIAAGNPCRVLGPLEDVKS